MNTSVKGMQSIYLPAIGLRWVNDLNKLVIINESQSDIFQLEDGAAALWRWLHQDIPFNRLLTLFAALNTISETQAEKDIRGLLEKWVLEGLIEVQHG